MKLQLKEYTWLIILGLGVFIYSDGLYYDFTQLDDQVQVVENQHIKSINANSIKSIFSSTSVGMYQPITTLVYAIVHLFFQLNPFGYHLIALIIHLLNSILVYRNLMYYTNKPLASLLTAVFLTHPLQVESVVWVSALSNLLYTTFFLISLLYYRLLMIRRENKYLTYAIIFFFLSAVSKSAAVCLPLVLFSLEWLESKSINWKRLFPFLLISIGFGIITIFSRDTAGHLSDLSQNFNWFERIFLISHNFLFYPIKFLLPFNLSAFYPYPIVENGMLPISHYISLPIIFALLYIAYRNQIIWFGTLFYLSTILLVTQIIAVGNQPTTDRYIYLPMLGLLIIVVSLLPKVNSKKLLIAFWVLPILLAFKSKERIKVWENDQLIWENVLDQFPRVSQAHNNLGSYLMEKGEFKSAEDHFNQAIKFKPYYADAYSNRGNLYSTVGNSEAAIKDYDKALTLKPHANAFFNRANEYAKLGRFTLAIEDYKSSLKIEKSADVYTNMAFVYINIKDYQTARIHLEKAISLNPKFDRANFLMGLSYQYESNKTDACRWYQKAKTMGSKNALMAIKSYCQTE